jgi:MATE family multidrug resistance protein
MFSSEKITYGFLLKKAWPIILANASVPLLGLVDTAVIGNTGSVEDLGAIAFGALIFSFVYWSFGFLRMGTTGFVAQAFGAEDYSELRAVVGRALLLAFALGLVLIGLQWPIERLAFALLNGSSEVEGISQSYFSIRIWGAPATLSIFALMGFLIGVGDSRQLLIVQLFLNLSNIGLDVLFAGIFGWGAEGIALGTVVAEWMTVALAVLLVIGRLKKTTAPREEFWPIRLIFNQAKLVKIMIRTLLLVSSFALFTNQSAQYGDEVLAANHILLQLVSFAAFFLDGYAFVVESLVGSAIGAGRAGLFDLAIRKSTVLAALTAALLGLAAVIFGDFAISLLTDIPQVREVAGGFLVFAGIYIACSFAAFQLDGVFIGASFTKQMRNAAIVSLAIFVAAWWVLTPAFAVSGLWCAMIVYVIARALALLVYLPAMRRSLMP